jgi:hypothetical protein
VCVCGGGGGGVGWLTFLGGMVGMWVVVCCRYIYNMGKYPYSTLHPPSPSPTPPKNKEAHVMLVSALDEVAWLFNIRGGDVEFNPVTIAYAGERGDGWMRRTDGWMVGLVGGVPSPYHQS